MTTCGMTGVAKIFMREQTGHAEKLKQWVVQEVAASRWRAQSVWA